MQFRQPKKFSKEVAKKANTLKTIYNHKSTTSFKDTHTTKADKLRKMLCVLYAYTNFSLTYI